MIAVEVQAAELARSAARLMAQAARWEAQGSIFAADVARREARLDAEAIRRLQAAERRR